MDALNSRGDWSVELAFIRSVHAVAPGAQFNNDPGGRRTKEATTMTNLTVNRDKQIIVNEGGIAHKTGFMVHQDGTIQRGNARREVNKAGTTVFCAEYFGEVFPCCINVEQFKKLTGWQAD